MLLKAENICVIIMLKILKLNILFTLLALTSTLQAGDLSQLSPVVPISDNQTNIINDNEVKDGIAQERHKQFYYSYVEREHSHQENLNHIAGVYAVTWAVYPLTQWDTFKNKGSLENYRNNFGRIVFDKDEPFWNWIVHPTSGSQLYLYYRANGYTRSQALTMAFISSSLFEFTVEIYTEPASIQDLYQTPILGSVFGLGIEKLSMYLLNTGNVMGKILGHVMNPHTLLWYYEGRVRIIPVVTTTKRGLNVQIDF